MSDLVTGTCSKHLKSTEKFSLLVINATVIQEYSDKLSILQIYVRVGVMLNLKILSISNQIRTRTHAKTQLREHACIIMMYRDGRY